MHGPHKGENLSETEQRARVGQAIRGALEDLWALEAAGWPIVGSDAAEPKLARAAVGLIDGKYRPDAVGQFCLLRNAGLAYRKWHMVEGRSSLRGAKAVWPARARHNRRGHIYREVNVDEAKHLLRELLSIPHEKPGAWHTYSDKSLESYHRHLVSEHFVSRKRGGREVRVWEKRPGAGPNHWWDCEVYQMAAAMACGVKMATMPQTAVVAAAGQRQQRPPARRARIRRQY